MMKISSCFIANGVFPDAALAVTLFTWELSPPGPNMGV